MKKLHILSTILLILSLSSCEKEIKTTENQSEEIATGKPSAPSPSILQWQKTYGGPSNEMGYAITTASEGDGYVFTASVLSNGGDVTGHHGGTGADVWVVKMIEGTKNIAWKKCLGGTNSDYAYDIITTTDGGYALLGNTKSNDGDINSNKGDNDIWVVKLDQNGAITWQKTFGGSSSETADAIVETIDGNLLVAGTTNSSNGDVSSNHGASDVWIIKLGSAGNVIWEKTFGGTSGDNAAAIIGTTDGNYMISAGTNSVDGDLSGRVSRGLKDCWLFKIDDSGNILWQKTLGGSQNDECNAILETPDGGFVFSGLTTSIDGDVVGNSSGNNAYFNTWVLKINPDGSIGWQKFFGGFDADYAEVKDVDALGNILLTGYTFSKNGDIPASKGGEDLWVLRLDENGTKLYSNVFGGRGGDMSRNTIPTSDGGYISVGRSSSTSGDVSGNQGGLDVWLMKFKFQ